jgi:hypothetical protein
MAAADVPNASKTDAQVVAQGILRSLISHNGKGVENVADGKPAKWKMKEAAILGGLYCFKRTRAAVQFSFRCRP